MTTYTLTFGDCGENHHGMEKIGQLASEGFSCPDLVKAQTWFENNGFPAHLINLQQLYPQGDEAYILVVPEGVFAFLNQEEFTFLCQEQIDLDKDTKALMRGRVCNKKARHNLCFGPVAQEPNYEQGKGRIVAFKDVPVLDKVRKSLKDPIGEKGDNLIVEGNYYYDIDKCYIGFHGDTERRKVIALRLGDSFPLHYQWYCESLPVGKRGQLNLGEGDIYFMSEKAVGFDWKKRKVPTLRHAAGYSKELNLNQNYIELLY